MKQSVTISVIVPTYHSNKEVLLRTIDSILNQSYVPIEIILVDDNGPGSYQDITKEVQMNYSEKLKVIYNIHNKGANFARNVGIKEAIGDYIAFLDADDEWHVDYLKEAALIIHDYNAMFLTTNYSIIHQNGTLPPSFSSDSKPFHENIFKKEIYSDLVGPTSTVIVKRSVLIESGLFDEKLPARQDYDMWLRVCRHAELYFNKNSRVKVFRDGHASISSSYKRNIEGTKIVLSKIMMYNDISNNEKKMVEASQYKHMALACILCSAYKESRKYSLASLKLKLDKSLIGWYLLSFMPQLFTVLREIRKNILYKKGNKQ